jgi:hypothetical protein
MLLIFQVFLGSSASVGISEDFEEIPFFLKKNQTPPKRKFANK